LFGHRVIGSIEFCRTKIRDYSLKKNKKPSSVVRA
jgi:hypothetical protein